MTAGQHAQSTHVHGDIRPKDIKGSMLSMDVYKYVVLLLHCGLLRFGAFLTNPL